MSTIFTTTIPETDCIGDSLDTINNNFDNLGTAVTTVSSTVNAFNVVDSPTIDLSFNSVTRTLSAGINPGSITGSNIAANTITNTNIAPGTITTNNISTTGFAISASQILGYSKGFGSFKDNLGDRGYSSYYRTNIFISNDKHIYVAGYGNGYGLGNGDSMLYADMGFHQSMIPLPAGETVDKIYTTGRGAPSMFALTNLGNLYSLGYNGGGIGALGLGDATNRSIWTKINISNVTWFSCSNGASDYNHCLAVNAAGQLYAWGWNGNGALGDNTTTSKNTPTLITVSTIGGAKIAKCFAYGDTYTSYNYSFVIDTNGQVYGTGTNAGGQLGIGNTSQQQVFQTVSSLQQADFILGNQYNANGTSFAVYGNNLYVSGFNSYGQLGLGAVGARNTFTQIPGLAVRSLATAGYENGSVIALLTNNTVRTWGWNGNGQLGLNNGTNQNTPQNPGLTNIKKVLATGWSQVSFYALDFNGDLWACGYNGYGQLGTGNTTQLSTFQKVIKDGNIRFIDFDVWGNDGVAGFTAVDQFGDLYTCGYNSQHSRGVPLINNGNITVPQRATIQ